jgi:hypothetical protein
MKRSCAVALTVFLSAAGVASAQGLPPPDPRAAFHLLTENDSFALFGHGTDRWYTNGFRFGWTSAEGNLPGFMAWVDGGLGNLLGPANSRWGLSIGQNIYTPADIRAFNPEPRDRPYAGYLYGSLTLDRRSWTTLDRFELQLGVVGPSSLGRQTQDVVHEILGTRQAHGWHYQLHDEPVFNLNAERTWRVPVAQLPGGLSFDTLPTLGVMAGTVRVSASAGARFRIGQGLERDFGVPRIRPAIADSPVPVGEGFGWYLFGGVGGYAVAHDIFLDGNTWRDSRHTDLRPFVGDLEAGAAIFWHNIRLSYTQVWRSKEFVAQPKAFTFGAFSLSFAF